MLVHYWYLKASQSLISTYLEIQDGGQTPNFQSLNGYNSGVHWSISLKFSTEFQHVTANTWFKVKGSKVKVTACVTANTDWLQICMVFGYLFDRVSASSIRTSRMRIAYSRRIRSTWRLPRALRKTSENNIFKPNKPEKIPERLARYRSAVEMQCFRDCTLSSLLLTRSVAPRHLIDHCTSQNAIFSNKKTENADNMPHRLARSRSGRWVAMPSQLHAF